MISTFLSMWLGKINVGYNNIKIRWLAYNNSIHYNDQQHSLITTLDLIKKIWINYIIPEYMEQLIYEEKDKIKVENPDELDDVIPEIPKKSLIFGNFRAFLRTFGSFPGTIGRKLGTYS